MRIGIFSDVHANLPALEAVLDTLQREGVDEVVCLGDLVGYGPHPRQVIRRLKKEGIQCLLGASDQRVAFPMPAAAREGVAEQTLEWAREQLGKDEVQFLRSLPLRYRQQLPWGRLQAMHGAPGDPEGRLDFEASGSMLVPVFERLGAQWIVSAGQHVPYARQVLGYWLIDPGSVGLSLGGEPGADALILDIHSEKPNIRLLKIPYDFEQVVFDLKAWDLPPVLQEVIRRGHYPG